MNFKSTQESSSMTNPLTAIFRDKALVARIKERLPRLFQIAEIESSRAGKTGMEVGSLREKIIVSLLIYKFGEANVDVDIPITEPETDARLFGRNISVKTVTGRHFTGVKLIWTVDAQKAKGFRESYYPHCDLLFVQINWGDEGGLYFIPLEVQTKLLTKMGKERYIKLPTPGTNPRGVEITGVALENLIHDDLTEVIRVQWQKRRVDYDPYKRWTDYWMED